MKFNYDLVVLIAWLIYGIYRLSSSEKISKFSYGCVWALLIIYLLSDYIETLI